MDRRPGRWYVVAAVAVGLLLAGCGDDERNGSGSTRSGPESRTVSPEAASPATGAVARGSAYELKLAAGWRDVTTGKLGSKLRRDLEPRYPDNAVEFESVFAKPDGSNMIVGREKLGELQLDELAAGDALKGASAGAPKVTEMLPMQLAAHKAYTYGFRNRTPQGALLDKRQVFVEDDGYLYTITFGASVAKFRAVYEEIESMLQTWRWT